MWSRRPEQEITSIKRRQWLVAINPLWPLILAGLLALLGAPLSLIARRRITERPPRLEDIPDIAVEMFLTGFILLWVVQILGRYFLRRSVLDLLSFSGIDFRICERCRSSCHRLIQARCHCGGRLEPRMFYQKTE